MTTIECGAVLFDLDGVLVDSTALVTRLWTHWSGERGLAPEDVLAAAYGQRTIDTMRAIARERAEEEAAAFDEREESETEGLAPLPGARELLGSLPGGRWAVVTSGSARLAKSRLQACGLPLPVVLVSADDVSNGKPDPECYLFGSRRLGIGPEEAVVIEDTPAGIQAARAAGMRTIAVRTTYPGDRLAEADFCVAGVHEIVASPGGLRLQPSGAKQP